MTKLYNNILISIKNALTESLFDDIFDDDFNTEDEDLNVMEDYVQFMNGKFKQHIIDTLCQSDNYHFVKEDEEDGLPYILLDETIKTRYYIAPFVTYKGLKLGPRKRKQYSKIYFYRYILDYLSSTGNIRLSIAKYNNNTNFVINKQLFNFISNSPYKLDEITFHKQDNVYTKYDGYFYKAYIIDGDSKDNNRKYPVKFIKNFPNIITPGEDPVYIDDKNPDGNGMTFIPRKKFNNDTEFLTLVEKIINNGFNIVDEDKFVYNKLTINDRRNELLSGELDKQVEENDYNKIKFIENQLGTEYVNKFNLLLNTITRTGDTFYLKTINSLRTCRISLEDTIYNLRKNNGLVITDYDEDIDEIKEYGYESRKYDSIMLWKMFVIMSNEKINDWKVSYDLNDCINGVDGYYGRFYLNINDLPIKIKDIYDIYKLYYVIGKALVQCKGLYDFGKQNNIHYNAVDNISSNDVREYGVSVLFDINKFDYSYLTEQLKTIIDKACKKHKIKVSKVKQLTESLFDDIDDIFSEDDEDMEILTSLEELYLPYVDLGLTSGTLWYKCNLGAKHEYDPGLYFQWGDTQGYKEGSYKEFNWKTYKYCKGTYNTMTKYCNKRIYGKIDKKLEIELFDDAAYKMTDGLAVIPTPILFKELYDECKWTWTLINGVNGYKVLSKKNSNYIFLPAAGYCNGSSVYGTGSYGYYWSRAVYLSDCNDAYRLYFYSSSVYPLKGDTRYFGFSVRPVLRKNKLNSK